tara:strand:+ start:672 stop:917 length:246 start_codon:yes stop_codon:yes gene_type:complete
MGPLALLGLAGGIGGLASLMKKKGIDLKKKELAKKIVKKKKKKKYVPEWQTETDPKVVKKQRENWKRTKKGFLDSVKKFMR